VRRIRGIRTTGGLLVACIVVSLAGISGAKANTAISFCEPNAPASNYVFVCFEYFRAQGGADQLVLVKAGSPTLGKGAFVAVECFKDDPTQKDFYTAVVFVTGVVSQPVFLGYHKPIAGRHCPGV